MEESTPFLARFTKFRDFFLFCQTSQPFIIPWNSDMNIIRIISFDIQVYNGGLYQLMDKWAYSNRLISSNTWCSNYRNSLFTLLLHLRKIIKTLSNNILLLLTAKNHQKLLFSSKAWHCYNFSCPFGTANCVTFQFWSLHIFYAIQNDSCPLYQIAISKF